MERCFIVSENSKLYCDYKAFEEIRNKNNEAMKLFLKENEIEAKSYSVGDNLAISATKNDLKKFEKQFKKSPIYIDGDNLYEFRKNSPIGKAFAALKLKPLYNLSIGLYIDAPIHRLRTRCFMYKGSLYVTVESEKIKSDTEMPDNWKEIKRSDFYKMLEEMEK